MVLALPLSDEPCNGDYKELQEDNRITVSGNARATRYLLKGEKNFFNRKFKKSSKKVDFIFVKLKISSIFV